MKRTKRRYKLKTIVIQRLIAMLLLVLSAIGIMVDKNITTAIVFIPLAMYLLFTRKDWIK